MFTKLTVEYDGTPFAGWVAQPGERSVSEELRGALGTLLRRDVPITVAGRTDRGVHARGQVVSYDGPPPRLRSLNALLPAEIAALTAEGVPDGFSARHDATSRTYVYRILRRHAPSALERGRALWWPHDTDVDALRACAAALPGVRDFRAFTPSETEHHHFRREVLDARWTSVGEGDILEFWIEARSFLRHMNRVLIGTMLDVGTGRRDVEDFIALLDGRPRSHAGATAPAHGLYLARVTY